MAKKTAPVPSSSSATKSAKPKATPAATSSSIDDIFAAPKARKSKLETPAAPVAGPSKSKEKPSKKEESKPEAPADASGSGAGVVEEKKKKKKVKSVAAFIPEDDASEPASRVETVVDPSTIPAAIPAPPAAAKSKKEKGKSLKRDRNEVDDDEIFRDSRGTGPRRQTEEGFLIFKEAELKIDPEAGGTPLCPFDCDCCF